MKRVLASFVIIALVISSVMAFTSKNVFAGNVNFNGDWVPVSDNDIVNNITGINILPNGTILCIADTKIIRSVDQGRSFIASNMGINGEARFIASDKDKIYSATFDSVYSSQDTGATWNLITTIKNDTISSISLINGDLYVGTVLGKILKISSSGTIKTIAENFPTINCIMMFNGNLYIGTTNGLFYYKNSAKYSLFNKKNVVSIANTQENGLLVLIHENISHGDENYVNTYIYTSKDGSSFKKVKKFENVSYEKIISGDGVVYIVSSNNGALQSANLMSWEMPSGLETFYNIDAFEVNPYNKKEIFISSGNTLLESSDKGTTVETLKKHIGNLSFNAVLANSDCIWAGTNKGVVKITGGKQLVEAGLEELNVKALAVFNSNLYAGTDKGLFVLKESGWKSLDVHEGVNAFAKNDTYLFIAAGNGLYKLSSASEIEKVKNSGFDIGVYSIYVDGDMLLAGTAFSDAGGLFVSRDYGKTWKKVPNTPGTDITSIYADDNGIYIGTWVMGVYYTNDNGNNWVIKNSGLGDLNITKLKTIGNIMYCTTTKGIYYSLNKGKFWNSFGENLDSSRVTDLSFYKDTFFASSWDGLFEWRENLLSAFNKSGQIALMWIDFPKGAKITGFELYKRVDSGSWKLLKKFDSTIHSFADKEIKNGEKYSYFIKSSDDKTPSNYFVSNEIETVADSVPPTIKILSPQDGAVVDSDSITVTGSVSDDGSGVDKVMINSQKLKIDNSDSFSADITLYEGENTITVVATDKAGNKTAKAITVTYRSQIIITLQPDNPYMTVNGVQQEIDSGRGTKPVIIPKWGRTVVPIRAIVEALGGTIGWDGAERKVTINFNGTVIELWIDRPQAKVNGVTKWIDENNHDVKPIIVNSRTMLPLRFVAESLGCTVNWDAATRTITITYTP
jgi:ligand-binding sensor domain-containing protein